MFVCEAETNIQFVPHLFESDRYTSIHVRTERAVFLYRNHTVTNLSYSSINVRTACILKPAIGRYSNLPLPLTDALGLSPQFHKPVANNNRIKRGSPFSPFFVYQWRLWLNVATCPKHICIVQASASSTWPYLRSIWFQKVIIIPPFFCIETQNPK